MSRTIKSAKAMKYEEKRILRQKLNEQSVTQLLLP
jgi:hypothetical protein